MSVMDNRRVTYLGLLVLTEPQQLTDVDLEMKYYVSLGEVGSISDIRIKRGVPNFPGGSEV